MHADACGLTLGGKIKPVTPVWLTAANTATRTQAPSTTVPLYGVECSKDGLPLLRTLVDEFKSYEDQGVRYFDARLGRWVRGRLSLYLAAGDMAFQASLLDVTTAAGNKPCPRCYMNLGGKKSKARRSLAAAALQKRYRHRSKHDLCDTVAACQKIARVHPRTEAKKRIGQKLKKRGQKLRFNESGLWQNGSWNLSAETFISPFYNIPGFDALTGCPFDPLHVCDLGVIAFAIRQTANTVGVAELRSMRNVIRILRQQHLPCVSADTMTRYSGSAHGRDMRLAMNYSSLIYESHRDVGIPALFNLLTIVQMELRHVVNVARGRARTRELVRKLLAMFPKLGTRIKLHCVDHLWDDIARYGSPQTISTQRFESMNRNLRRAYRHSPKRNVPGLLYRKLLSVEAICLLQQGARYPTEHGYRTTGWRLRHLPDVFPTPKKRRRCHHVVLTVKTKRLYETIQNTSGKIKGYRRLFCTGFLGKTCFPILSKSNASIEQHIHEDHVPVFTLRHRNTLLMDLLAPHVHREVAKFFLEMDLTAFDGGVRMDDQENNGDYISDQNSSEVSLPTATTPATNSDHGASVCSAPSTDWFET